jgi:hypothetical protein
MSAEAAGSTAHPTAMEDRIARCREEGAYTSASSAYGTLRVRALIEGHRAYLPWHRARVFKNGEWLG